MKNKLLSVIYMLSRYFLYGFLIQLMVFNLVFATEVNGQYKSIDEVSISFQKENYSLGQFFSQVEKQTTFKFSFDKKDIEISKSVSFPKHRNCRTIFAGGGKANPIEFSSDQ
jgi:TonB-dependent starch-binding outer membrane protein SusC